MSELTIEATPSVDRDFCWSCGTTSSGVCSSCGDEPCLDRQPGGDELGSVLTKGHLFWKTYGLVVDEQGETTTIVGNDGNIEELDESNRTKWRKSGQGEEPGPGSPVRRLLELTLSEGKRWGPAREALPALVNGSSSARELASGVAALGATSALDLVSDLPLSESERNWIAMHTYAAAGLLDESLEEALKLPRDCYADKLGVVLVGLNQGLIAEDQALGLAELFPADPTANLVRLAVDDRSSSEPDQIVAATEVMARIVEAQGDNDASKELDVIRGLIADPQAQGEADLQKLRGQGELMSLGWNVLFGEVPKSVSLEMATSHLLCDELLAKGTEVKVVDPEADPYLLARTNPAELTDQQIEQLEFSAEKARRAFLRGDLGTLERIAASNKSDRYLQRLLLSRLTLDGDSDAAAELANVVEDPEEGKLTREFARALDGAEISSRLLQDESLRPALARPRFRDTLEKDGSSPARAILGWGHLSEAKDALLSWDWPGAISSAREALRWVATEAERDEALNLLAYGHYQLGNERESIDALERALDGEYTVALQTNIGVVAEALEPSIAAEHLGRLANEAPSLQLQAAAAMRSLELWTETKTSWTDEEREEEDDELPEQLRTALRRLATANLPLDQHARVVRMLSQYDAGWLSDVNNTSLSPHCGTSIHRVFVARAEGINAQVETLISEVLSNPEDELVVDELNSFVALLVELLTDPEPSTGPASFALELLDSGVPLMPLDEIILRSGSTRAVATTIDTDESSPSERLLDGLEKASKRLEEVPLDRHEFAALHLEVAYDAYGRCFHDAALSSLGNIESSGNQIVDLLNQMGPYERVDYSKLRQLTGQLLKWLEEVRTDVGQTVKRLEPHIRDDDLKEALQGLVTLMERTKVWLIGLGRP
jgi:hypothetical protein